MPQSVEPTDPPHTCEYDPVRALLQPRDYQRELVQALYEQTQSTTPGKRLLLVVATGGGKNVIANEFAWRHAVAEGKRVLRVTMNWELTRQSAANLCVRYDGAKDKVSFVGNGTAARAMNGLRKSPNGQVVFTTIHSWYARKDTDFAEEAFDYVVIDEVHWGEDATLYDALYERYRVRAVFVGLTATPRRWTQYQRVGRAYDLSVLVQAGYLAEPLLEVIHTGVGWRPRLTSEHGDVTQGSLRQLSTSERRNELIVSTYSARAADYRKTIVFACNIVHADTLSAMFVARGVRAAALHSKMDDVSRARVIGAFRARGLDVLVNAAAAIHGLDVPDLQTVMLARPTTSDILMMQMIGRGARLAPGKQSFYLVDFVDNAAAHGGVPLLRPRGFIGSRLGPGVRGPRRPEHGYEAAALEPFPAVAGYEALEGLLVQPEQTFGIEFELTSADFSAGPDRSARWRIKALKLLEALRGANLPTATSISDGHGSEKDNSVWNVEYDASCGWEITSRILSGFAGFIEIADACQLIARVAAQLGLDVTIRTGTHVHLGWTKDAAPLLRLFEVAAFFEPALLSLVAPSRANSRYAQSVRRMLRRVRDFATTAEWKTFLRPLERRYLAVNPRGLFHGYGTVEIRMHSGTIEAPKILTWLSLWMAIFAAAEERRPLPGDPTARLRRAPLSPGVRGDVAALVEYVGGGVPLMTKLLARREHVVSNSWVRARNPRHRGLAERLLRVWQQDAVRRQQTTSAAAE